MAKHKHLPFILKILRNSVILAIGYFVANIETYQTFCWDEFKPMIIFVGFYLVAELTYRYKINVPKRGKSYVQPLFF